jgi:hypothetical protein
VIAAVGDGNGGDKDSDDDGDDLYCRSSAPFSASSSLLQRHCSARGTCNFSSNKRSTVLYGCEEPDCSNDVTNGRWRAGTGRRLRADDRRTKAACGGEHITGTVEDELGGISVT